MSFEKRKADGFMTKKMAMDIKTYNTGYIELPEDRYTLDELKEIIKAVERQNKHIEELIGVK
ncbi:hypothetical protein EB001_14485 [bacterium]|nr:hypothetical protein [bacterium]